MKTYNAVYNPEVNKGVYAISLVENPAMEGLFVALSKDETIQLKTVNEEQRILMGLVLEPNKPIYRNQNGEEFNIIFSEQTVKDLSYGFFKNKSQSNSTIEHEIENKITGVTFTESWIVDNPKIDKSANYGFNYPKGSWMAVMKVDNDDVWNEYVKSGKVQGFSVDAMLSLEEVKLKSNITMSEQAKTNSLLEKILLAFTSNKEEETPILLGAIMTADGQAKIEFDGETLEAGASIWITAPEGEKVAVPVGDYPLEDGTILVVKQEGVVDSINPAQEPAPMPSQDMADAGKNDAQIAQEIESAIKSILIKYSKMSDEFNDMSAKFKAMEQEMLELKEQPAAKPIKATPVNVDLSKMTAKQRIAYGINNLKN